MTRLGTCPAPSFVAIAWDLRLWAGLGFAASIDVRALDALQQAALDRH